MWGSSEEPPGTMEAGPPPLNPPESVANLKETCEQSKYQLESVKDIMLKNKESLKKKEEELQEYAKKLTKFKTRAKRSNRSNRDDTTSSSESTPKSKSDTTTSDPALDVVDDISQAKTPLAKSSLLQKKLAEDRKIFEQRSKELTESKRAAEEKVEALRQQLEEKYVAPVSVVTPVLVTSQSALPVVELSHMQDKDHKIVELSNKIFELEAIIMDLQENLKEKDSVLDSKTKAITLMSADLSKKGKTTLDTLEDTKDEMRSMQENFVLVEKSLRSKNDNLLKQLEKKASHINILEENIQSLSSQLKAQKQAEVVSADFSRSTMDTLADTKDAMKSMQENFVLIETSLKDKNENLLKQLEEREMKLAEAEAKILHLESGLGIERHPDIGNLSYKIEKLEQENRNLQDEKYELQKSISELQNQIVVSEPTNNDAFLLEKDNKIAELENFIEKLKKSHEDREESYKTELQKQIESLNAENQNIKDKFIELGKHVSELDTEKSELSAKLRSIENETPKDDDRVQQLTKQLDELNKSMIKLKAQHKNKLKNLQKQLKSFEKVSDTNAELVKLANQITLLEEEKGNLQLSLVDFDELKASAGEWLERIRDLEGKVSAQTKEIESHIEAIAILENQKLDLMQEFHAIKQEVSSLEAENAESENSRVTAEMKVVDLEEQLEALQKQSSEAHERLELQRQLEGLRDENERLTQKVLKLEELKASSDVGSTESFVKTGSNVDSTESFEALNADAERADLLRKIDGLTRENGALMEKLTRYEEKGSSDSGSTESFERIPEQGETSSRLENLTRENYELVVKVTKLEEKLSALGSAKLEVPVEEEEEEEEIKVREVRSVEAEVSTVQTEAGSTTPGAEEESVNVQELLAKICKLTALNENLTSSLHELEKEKSELVTKLATGKQAEEAKKSSAVEEEKSNGEKDTVAQEFQGEEFSIPLEKPTVESSPLIEGSDEQPIEHEDKKPSESELAAVATLEAEIARCSSLINEQKDAIEDLRSKLAEKESELERKSAQIASDSEACKLDVASLRRELEDSASSIMEWKTRCTETESKLESLEHSKLQIAEAFQALQVEKNDLLEESERKNALVSSLKEELDRTIVSFEEKLKQQEDLIASQEEIVRELRKNISIKEQELKDSYEKLRVFSSEKNELMMMTSMLEEEFDRRKERDAAVAAMTTELEALRTNSSYLEEDLFAARHQLLDLQKKLENTKSAEEYEQLEDSLNNKMLLVEELEGKIAQRVAEIEALKSQIATMGVENEQLRQQLQEEERKAAEFLESNRSQEEALRNAERTRAELENRFLELQSIHDEHEWQLRSNSDELRDAYKLMEQLKIKHTEDINMLNRRLEDSLEELQLKAQEIASLQNDLDQKNSLIAVSVPGEVKSGLESQVTDLEKRLSEAEEKSQAQLEKMKKYAAVAKKKTAQVEELETKIKELEEKCASEMNEIDAKNKESQQSLSQIQEKDNRIVVMEEELRRAQTERDEAQRNVLTIKAELDATNEKLSVLKEELHESNEVKERARELGVRMEVMEKEYMEQLAQINSLKTENGLLLSKQAQINERLENIEKESEERRVQLEKLEKEKEIENTRKESETHEICAQCATRVQALEAKLQERDAEIENLDNELHNSIGNLVQMQENLRMSTIPDNSLHGSYNELVAQLDALTASNEETRNKYEAVLKENHELSERVAHLKALNTTAQARIDEVERELAKDREIASSFQNEHAQYVELLERFEKQKAELETSQAKLHEALAINEGTQRELRAQIEQLELDKQSLIQKYEQLKQEKSSLAQEIEQLRSTQQQNVVVDWGLESATSSVFDIEAQPQLQDQEPSSETIVDRPRRDVEESLNETPPLFDASVFGAPQVQPGNAEFDLEIERLRDEMSTLRKQAEEARLAAESVQAHLNGEIQQARDTVESLTNELHNLNTARADLEAALAAKNAEVASLSGDAKAAKDALAEAKTDHESLSAELEQKNAWIIHAMNERESNLGQLERLSHEKQEIERIVRNLLLGTTTTSGSDGNASLAQQLQSFEIKHNELLSELEAAKGENRELLAAQDLHKNKIVQLEIEAKTSGDSAVIAELETRIGQLVSERDILQLQLNDVTRAYEDLKDSADHLRNVRSQLEAVSHERNQLAREIEAFHAGQAHKIEKREEEAQQAAPVAKLDVPTTAESMWEDEEDPWGFNVRSSGAEQHVDIPIVPSTEIQLRLKVDELEEKLKELTDENAKLIEEGRLAQVKNVKYVKKLKEYKVQFDSLQRELKSQKSIGGFGDLDSAIEDELKSQIANLEKILSEARDDNKKLVAEKDNLLKRIEVLMASTERFAEAKEKQDTELHIWQMRYKELELKTQQLEFGPETRDSTSSPPQQSSFDANPAAREAEIKELRESIDALAAENEELQQLLEEHRTKRQTSAKENEGQIQELRARNAELSASLDKLKADYDALRRQYEQSLMDANDQVQQMRQNCELLKTELAEKGVEGEKVAAELHAVKEAKAELETRVESLEVCASKLNSTSLSLEEVTQVSNARAQEVASLQEELRKIEAERAQLQENAATTAQQVTDALSEKQAQLDELKTVLAAKDDELSRQKVALEELKGTRDRVKGLELSIEGYVTEVLERNEKINELQGKLSSLEAMLSEREQQVTSQQSQLQQSASEVQQCASRVQAQQELADRLAVADRRADELSAVVAEKETSLERSVQEIDQLRFDLQSKVSELEEVKAKLESMAQEQSVAVAPSKEVTGAQGGTREVTKDEEQVPMFTFGSDIADSGQDELNSLRAQLKTKDDEIEHLLYSLNQAKTTRMIQELQDNVNALYNEKSYLEEQIIVKNQEIHALKTQLDDRPQQQQHQQQQSSNYERRKRSFGEQEDAMKLQNELRSKEQQINDLRYMLAEKEAMLNEALPVAEEAKYKAYENYQEIESYKLTVDELQAEVASLRGLERLAAEDKATIERLNSEKESLRWEAQQDVERLLLEKEAEIDNIKRQLADENQRLMNDIGLRERDVENLKKQLMELAQSRDNHFEQQLSQMYSEIEQSKRERENLQQQLIEVTESRENLAELSATKDTEIHNMRIQLSDMNARIEQLAALREEQEGQLEDMRKLLEMREQQINGLMHQFEEKSNEYELIHNALQRHMAKPVEQSAETSQHQLQQQSTSEEVPIKMERELDLALYMLHQRDVRCEELALELTQLVDERDTLQLRLSNALRVNEELKKYADSSLTKDPSQASSTSQVEAEPLVENPSPSRSEGPVEIAKEAIDSPIGEDKKALAQKLSQLKSVDQRRDVRLKDDREQRHSQQMMLMAHKEVLSKLPPEAAARLVNANYTLSRDVQSQSSVLMNWLWGKSTPKVMHM